jgi:dihydroorotate dehydrogenase (fumarate)
MEMEIDLSTRVGNIFCETPFWNASGVNCTTLEELQELASCSNISAVVTKSCTNELRKGNPMPRYKPYMSTSSINSMGLPNQGIQYYLDSAEKLYEQKPIVISLAGLSLKENSEMISKVCDNASAISGVEVNLSCPNIPGKPQVGYDFEAMRNTLDKLFDLWEPPDDSTISFGVKLPPYFDLVHFGNAADVLSSYPKLHWLTCINSIGNGLLVDPISEKTLIRPKGGLGGIGGQMIKATALANVRTFRELMPESVDIIGCGGIFKGSDIFEHILCGASSVQIGTFIAERGVSSVQILRDELEFMMRVKGYSKLSDFRGKLKVIDESL